MYTSFEDITGNYEDNTYITVASSELTLKVLPFYSLPARKIAELYSKKSNQQKFIKEVYKLLQLSMAEPQHFKAKVYDTAVSYSGLIAFVNAWINTSTMIHKYEAGEIDDDGNNTTVQAYNNSEVIHTLILNKMSKGDDVKNTLLIRYFIEQIRELAYEHNKTAADKDIIYEVNIDIPIGEEMKNGY